MNFSLLLELRAAGKKILCFSLKHSVVSLKNIIRDIDKIDEVVYGFLLLLGGLFSLIIGCAVIIVKVTALCQDRVFEIQVAFQKQLFRLPGNALQYQGQKPFR